MSFHFVVFLFLVASSSSTSRCSSIEKERTLAMIKPDGLLGNYSESIKNRILESSFVILMEKTTTLDEDRASGFYAEHSSKSFFSSLVKYMTSGPVLAMVLEKENAIADWRRLIGPTDSTKAKTTHPQSIRAMCGLDSERNCVHGSDSHQSAQREIAFFFNEISSEIRMPNTSLIPGQERRIDSVTFTDRGYKVSPPCQKRSNESLESQTMMTETFLDGRGPHHTRT